MTRKLNNVWIRGIFSVLLGALLVLYPGAVSIYFVMLIGALFFVPGLLALIAYLRARSQGQYFPFMGLGSLLFGLWLLIMPGFFVYILMYILGAVLVLGGLNTLVGLMQARRHTRVAWGFYVVPVLVLASGIVVLVNPFQVAELPFIVLGAASIIYGLSDMVGAYRFRRTGVEIIDEPSAPADAEEARPLEIEEKPASGKEAGLH